LTNCLTNYMPNVTIKNYRKNEDGSEARSERKLVRTVHLETTSGKSLTAKRAAQLLARGFPKFRGVGGGGLGKTDEGWSASRTIRPRANCAYHFIWEYAFVTEDDSVVETA